MQRFKAHLIYWILPSVVILACIVFYFYDIFHWSVYIAPEFNREFGVVENLQLLIIILMAATALKGVRLRIHQVEKNAFKIIFILSVTLFLEEIDYGIHYYEYFSGKSIQGVTGELVPGEKNIRNIHNNWKITNILKLVAYALIAIFFVLFPLIPKNKLQKYPVFNYLVPSKYIITTAISTLILNQIALHLYQTMQLANQSLRGNVSEFEEIMIYYIGFLYLREMVHKPTNITIGGMRKKQIFNFFKT